MNYIVSEEELWKVFQQNVDWNEFFESKQPIELVAEGMLGYSFSGYTIDKKLISDISYEKIGGGLHKKIKIFIQKNTK